MTSRDKFWLQNNVGKCVQIRYTVLRPELKCWHEGAECVLGASARIARQRETQQRQHKETQICATRQVSLQGLLYWPRAAAFSHGWQSWGGGGLRQTARTQMNKAGSSPHQKPALANISQFIALVGGRAVVQGGGKEMCHRLWMKFMGSVYLSNRAQ